jgi:hypothetical protein
MQLNGQTDMAKVIGSFFQLSAANTPKKLCTSSLKCRQTFPPTDEFIQHQNPEEKLYQTSQESATATVSDIGQRRGM